MRTLRQHVVDRGRHIVRLANRAFSDTSRYSSTIHPDDRQIAVVLGLAAKELGLAGQVGFLYDYRIGTFRAVVGIRGGQVSLRLRTDRRKNHGRMPVFAAEDLIVEDFASPTPCIAEAAAMAADLLRRRLPAEEADMLRAIRDAGTANPEKARTLERLSGLGRAGLARRLADLCPPDR